MAAEVRSLASEVEAAVSASLDGVVPPGLAGADPLVRRSEHADFQSNVAMALARKAGADPRELASGVAAALDDYGFVASVQVAAPERI